MSAQNHSTDKLDVPALPPRPADGHKGTFGTVCVIGGQCAGGRVMIGGPALSALAALRAGAGLAVLALPKPIVRHALTIAPTATGIALPVDRGGALDPSATAELLDQHTSTFDCIAMGPGLGTGDGQRQIVLRLIAQDELPLVIDADALNCLAQTPDFRGDFRAKAVLTPHPGEFRRLAKPLGIKHDPTNPASRGGAASELAQRLGCVVVLKGHHTVISDGQRTVENQTGNVALATGGTGDVLTGIIAGFIAQFFRAHLGMGSRQVSPQQQGGLGLFECAHLAVHLGGLAADRWARDHGNAGMLATDMLGLLPDVIAAHRARSSQPQHQSS